MQLRALHRPACSLVDWGRARQQRAADWAWGCRHENEHLGTGHKNVADSLQIGALPSPPAAITLSCLVSTNFDFGNTPKYLVCFQKTSARFNFAESVSVLLTCFSQLGERDLIPLLLNFSSRYKTYLMFSFASTCKNNSADFGKRWIELDPNLNGRVHVAERKGACGCLDVYCNVDLHLRRNSNASKYG